MRLSADLCDKLSGRKASYSFISRHCGKSFMAFANSDQKYCFLPCAIAERAMPMPESYRERLSAMLCVQKSHAL